VRIVFLRSCQPDLEWFRTYYETVFSAGAKHAEEQVEKSLELLRHNPFIGHSLEEKGTRELPISRTPFSLVYRVTREHIEIISVLDQRSNRPTKWPGQ
jgi:plasmid stabilization system protein ParE